MKSREGQTHPLHRPRATAPKPTTVPWNWPQAHKDALGMSCIWKAGQALNQLGPPFMIEQSIQEPGETLVLKFPCFAEDQDYKAEQGWLCQKPERQARWATWKQNSMTIERHLAAVPEPSRTTIRRTLSLLNERDRLYAAHTLSTIRWFLKTIKRERIRLKAIRRAACTLTLFPICAPTECDAIQDRLDQAEKIVTKARTILEPARVFYLSKKAPSQGEAYRVILQALHSVPGVSKYKATQRAKALLDLADPGCTTTFGSLRQRFYQ